MRTLCRTILAAAAMFAAHTMLNAAEIAPFPDGARVAFFGDSITRGGGGVLRVAAHYRKAFPGRDVRFYNVGISGGGVQNVVGRHPAIVCTAADRVREEAAALILKYGGKK